MDGTDTERIQHANGADAPLKSDARRIRNVGLTIRGSSVGAKNMFIPPPPDFRGFVWEPSSEQDVVVLFGRLLERGDLPVVIDYSWTAFPDCVATDLNSGKPLNIEFEFRSGNFWTHLSEWRELKAADPAAQWWVASWKDDLTESQRRELAGVEIIPLRDRVRSEGQTLNHKTVLNWYDGEPDDARQMFEWRSAGLTDEQRRLIHRLQKFGSQTHGFSLEWPIKPDLPWFTVRHDATGTECFKVHANGRIGFPFSRWRSISTSRKTEILNALNSILATNWFTGRENRKKGRDTAWLLREGIDRFLAAWETNLLV